MTRTILWMVCVASVTASLRTQDVAQTGGGSLDAALDRFMKDHKYNGGSIGVMQNGRLVYAKGFGVTPLGKQVHAGTIFPIYSISKSITAVAILQLVENGKINLTTRVFGDEGVLHMYEPIKSYEVDSRVFDITIDHLLRHTAGWDSNKPPMYDPVLNSAYVSKGYTIPNIATALKVVGPLLPQYIIQYIISQPLDYSPGRKSIYSNLGYTILGQIIELLADTPYDDYVKKHVLTPCGMWRTHIGPSRTHNVAQNDLDTKAREEEEEAFGKIGRIYDLLNPELVDAALGWYSNVIDLARFMKCVDNSAKNGILKHRSLEEISRKSASTPNQHSETWYGAGFHANTHGAIWQDGDMYSDDHLLYHKHFDRVVANETIPTEAATAWIVLLNGKNHIHLKHEIRKIMDKNSEWSAKDAFTDDLADSIFHSEKGIDTIVKYKISEHHITSYINALKSQRFALKWITAYTNHGHTYISVIAQNANGPIRDYIVEHGLTSKKFHSKKKKYSKDGYRLRFLQGYRSFPHDGKITHLALFQAAESSQQLPDEVFGYQSHIEFFKKTRDEYAEKGYSPRVQSLMHHKETWYVTYILDKYENKNYKSYTGITLKDLETTVKTNALAERHMIYLDSTEKDGQPLFSVIFQKDKPKKWLFKLELSLKSIHTELTDKQNNGFIPTILVGYTNQNGDVRFAAYLEKGASV